MISIFFAPIAGRIADRKGPRIIIVCACLLMLAAWACIGGVGIIVVMIAGVVMLDLGTQSAQVSNLHIIQSLLPEARNRLNAILMGGMFFGGAFGSAGAAVVWKAFGWGGVSVFGALLVTAAMALSIGNDK